MKETNYVDNAILAVTGELSSFNHIPVGVIDWGIDSFCDSRKCVFAEFERNYIKEKCLEILIHYDS